MNDENDVRVVRTVYLDPDVDQRLRQLSYSEGKTKSEIIRRLIDSGLLAFEASGERTISDRMDERHRLLIKHREEKIADLVKIIDIEFDARWEKIKSAIKTVYEE